MHGFINVKLKKINLKISELINETKLHEHTVAKQLVHSSKNHIQVFHNLTLGTY